ncbi:MAG: MATE family efflux transporter [Lachnospiraceae bacterium]|nr:MATE family efflux transporter [Lachnospiraceae bacterium]
MKKYIITDKAFYSEALMIVLPVVLQAIINQGVNMMDTIMVGKLGEAAISASSLANQFYNIYTFLCMGLSAAGLVLAAQYWGAGDKVTVRKVFDILIQIIFAASTLFAILSLALPRQIISLYTNDQEVIAAGAGYLRITALVYLPHGIALVISNIMRSVGNARIGLYVSLASFFVNIGCNYVFIFGKLGFPAMGVSGAALGTLCSRAVEFGVCTFFVLVIDRKLCYRPTRLLRQPEKPLLREFIRLGLPAIISDTILAFASSAIGMILGHMGREFVSAYSIVSVVDRMCTLATSGVGSAAGIMVGQSVGAGEAAEAKRRGFSFLMLTAVLGVIGAILVVIVGDWSISLYDITPDTIAITRTMMIASALVVPFQNISSTLGKGVLRGGGDTQFLMVADVIFQWVASIPLGYLAGLVLNLSPFAVLLIVRIDYVIKGIWFIQRLTTDKWIHQVKRSERAS